MKFFVGFLFFFSCFGAHSQDSCKALLSLSQSDESLRGEIEKLASTVNMRQLNVKSESFVQFSQNLYQRLMELKPRVEATSRKVIKGDYNSLVLKAVVLTNIDDYQMGFVTNPSLMTSMPLSVALDLLVERSSDEHYAYLAMEFYSLISSENSKDVKIVLEEIRGKDQFEAIALAMFKGHFEPDFIAILLNIENVNQRRAFSHVAHRLQLSDTILNAILIIQNEEQLDVFKVAFDYQVVSADFYFETLPAIVSEDQSAEAIRKIKARIYE